MFPSFYAPNVFNMQKRSDDDDGFTHSWLIYDPTKRNEVWRFISYIFLHGGVQHITFNLIIQVLVGEQMKRPNQ